MDIPIEHPGAPNVREDPRKPILPISVPTGHGNTTSWPVHSACVPTKSWISRNLFSELVIGDGALLKSARKRQKAPLVSPPDRSCSIRSPGKVDYQACAKQLRSGISGRFDRERRFLLILTFWRTGAGLAVWAGGLVLALTGQAEPAEKVQEPLVLHARVREADKAGAAGSFVVKEQVLRWQPAQTAIIICDMWNQHWCQGATRRVGELAPAMNRTIAAARAKGVFIIHAPSSCMNAYQDHPARKRAQAAPKAANLPAHIGEWCNKIPSEEKGIYPIDQSDGGCDDTPQCPQGSPWKTQVAAIEIQDDDAISDSGAEIWNLLESRGITNVMLMGVHTNMCVLGRPFGLRNLARSGKNVALVRDLTDTMYNSRMWPYVSHFEGTNRIVEHIEKFVAPTIASTDLTGQPPFQFKPDLRPRAVCLIGEDEYKTEVTLPAFAAKELEPLGVRCTFVIADPRSPNDFRGVEALNDANLLILSVRRRAPKAEQLAIIRQYALSGRPVVGIRTACHAFDVRGKAPAGHAEWTTFDPDVLGGHYTGHHDNNLHPKVTLAPGDTAHLITRGIETPFVSHGSLYKVNPLAAGTQALLLGTIPGHPPEPVAWVNMRGRARVFYTSLGHPDDFELASFRTMLRNAVLWALDRPLLDRAETNAPATKIGTADAQTRSSVGPDNGPRPPRAALASFKVPDDLQLELVLAEPIVRQPVSISFDKRGRLWVVQYLQYPHPAGVKMVSHDGVWRAVYDKVPPPPPHHFRGKDKITIHEDTDGDGVFDRHKTFLDGLNIATSVARGRGGVWVLNPPYLLFYPDRDNDDVPDGDPEVHLRGFGLEDTHSVVNSLQWGPDGWLYAAQGSTVTGHVTRPGLDTGKEPVHSMGQLIWRYHPETRRYEVFAEGGGNAFGLEIDAKGRLFSGHNGGDTRGFHYVQGGYYQKGFNKHGPLSNPYSFGYFPAMKHNRVPRFTHTFVIYEGNALPERYHGLLFGVAPLLNHVVMSEVRADGSSVRTQDIGVAVATDDAWFRPVDIELGPDGDLYIADWYDRQVNHYRNHEGQIEHGDGRIYRLKSRNAASAFKPSDLSRLRTPELVERLTDRNKWTRQTALRLIADRRDASIAPALKLTIEQETGQNALEALWALSLVGGLDESTALKTLDHADPFVRLWTARLLCDASHVSSSVATALVRRAEIEPDVSVRAQLACSSKRLPARDALPIVRALLARGEDLHDIHLPLLLWWALEAKVASEPDAVLALFQDRATWALPIVQATVTERLMRRFAAAGTRQDLTNCARLLAMAPGPDHVKRLMLGFEAAAAGRGLSGLPSELAEALGKFSGQSVTLGLRQGKPEALSEALRMLSDERADRTRQLQYLQILSEVHRPACVPIVLSLACHSSDNALRAAALGTLAGYDDPAIPGEVIRVYANMSEDVLAAAQSLLVTRRAWAARFLEAIDDRTIDLRTVPREVVDKLLLLADSQITALATRLFGATKPVTSAEFRSQINRLAAVIRAGDGIPKQGKQIFDRQCSRCHTLFSKGGNVGPDLTTYRRDDLETMLLSIVNPSAEVREGYACHIITLTDGRLLSGALVEQDKNIVVLRGGDGKDFVLARSDIEAMRPSAGSIMPEGLLRELSDQQVRDLFAYLRSTQPLID
jgi:putative heme-binding domain-containing protein